MRGAARDGEVEMVSCVCFGDRMGRVLEIGTPGHVKAGGGDWQRKTQVYFEINVLGSRCQ